MNCEEFSEIVFDLAKDEELDEATKQRAFVHADVCPHCDGELEKARELASALSALAASTAAAAAPRQVEDILLGEFRKQRSVVAMPMRAATRWAIGGAVALAAALILSVVILHREISRRSNLSVSPSGNAIARKNDSNSNAPPPRLPAASNSAPIDATPVNAAGVDASVQDSDNEYATDYISLPSADGAVFAEDETIVRVSMPPSALASFGLPVSTDGRDSAVLADFVLGEDGMPRAVRLVRAN